MEQPQTTPSVQSPRIQFREPSFSYAGGPLGVGVDGRRLSVSDATNEVFIDDDPTEDWTRTTSEKDSWAHRERRRSSMWHKIESYPSTKPTVAPSTSPRRSGERTRLAASSACSNTARTRTAAMSCTPARQMTGITRALQLLLQPPSRTSHHRPRTCRETGVEAS